VVSIMGEMGRAFDGSYAEYVLLPNEQIYPIKTSLDWKTLAALPETYYTAYGSLLKLQIRPSDTVLVRGATSGVGLAFANLLKARLPDIALHGSTRASNKSARLHDAGFDEVIIDDQGSLKTDWRYDRILELIGPATLRNSFDHVAENGIVCSTGQLGNQWYLDEFDPIMELKNDSYLTSFYSGFVNAERLNALFAYVDQYQVKVPIERVFRLSEVAEAHRFLQSSDSFGKVIVIND
jgi:putative uncharacterized protein (fragment)